MICRRYEILLHQVNPDAINVVCQLVDEFRNHNEYRNIALARAEIDKVVPPTGMVTMLILDADKALAPQDGADVFWRQTSNRKDRKSLFESRLDHTYLAFRQATLLCEEAADAQHFEDFC